MVVLSGACYSGTCSSHVGEPCTADPQCAGNLSHDVFCHKGVCLSSYGVSSDDSSQCLSNECISSHCDVSELGEGCRDNSHCVSGSICVAGGCRLELGETCSADSECVYNHCFKSNAADRTGQCRDPGYIKTASEELLNVYCANNNCCRNSAGVVGSCTFASDFSGFVTIYPNSCIGDSACEDISSTTVIKEGSCKGTSQKIP